MSIDDTLFTDGIIEAGSVREQIIQQLAWHARVSPINITTGGGHGFYARCGLHQYR
ncbi:MAG: hypothetical protein GYB65_04070 [Chloroflexi bacterium]|nr:hypothetical protein [Chloroflexota bacterium]